MRSPLPSGGPRLSGGSRGAGSINLSALNRTKTVTGQPATRGPASSSSSLSSSSSSGTSAYFPPPTSSAPSQPKPPAVAATTKGGRSRSALDAALASDEPSKKDSDTTLPDLLAIADAELDDRLFPPSPKTQPMGPPAPRPTHPSGGNGLLKHYGSGAKTPSSSSSFPSLSFSSSSSLLPSSSSSSLAVVGGAGQKRGLRNLGNTCYMNSVVQSMAAALGFSDDLLSDFWLRQTLPDLRLPAERQKRLKVFGSLTHLLLTMRENQKGAGSVTDPTFFRRAMAAYFAPYGGSRQQDAHEFMGDMLNTLQEELCYYGRRFAAEQLLAQQKLLALTAGGEEGDGPDKKKAKTAAGPGAVVAVVIKGRKLGGEQQAAAQQTKLSSFFKPRTPSFTAGDDAPGASSSSNELVTALEEDTVISKEEAVVLERVLPVTRHFHAEVEKTLTCVGKDCAYSRSYLESYTDFSVDLVAEGEEAELLVDEEGGNPLQIFDLLAHCFQDQELELACDQCRAQDKVKVTFRIRKLPHLLIVHLKRFRITGGLGLLGASSSKLQSRVMAPVTLDLAQFCDEQTANPRDVSTGLDGPAGPELVKQVLACQPAAPSPPPRAPGKGGGGFLLGGAKGGEKGGGTGTTTPLAPQQRLQLQKHKKQAEALSKKEGEEDRWSSEEKKQGGDNKRKGASTSLMSDIEDDAMLIDLVGDDATAAASSSSSAEEKQLQEAIRLSLIESRGGGGSGGGSGGDSGSSSLPPPSPAPMAIAEDKENRRPPAQAQQAKASSSSSSASSNTLPLDLRNITTRTSTGTTSSAFSTSSSSPPARAEELRSSYELQSVVRHLGRSANSGHYIADVRRTKDGGKVLWTRYDDSLVSSLAEGDNILQDDRSLRTGYIFLYRSQPN